MIIKNRVLRKYVDNNGLTLVMIRKKLKKRKYWFDKIISKQKVVIWTTLTPNLVIRSDFIPGTTWLRVNPEFKYWNKHNKSMKIHGPLKDLKFKEMANIYLKVLTKNAKH